MQYLSVGNCALDAFSSGTSSIFPAAIWAVLLTLVTLRSMCARGLVYVHVRDMIAFPPSAQALKNLGPGSLHANSRTVAQDLTFPMLVQTKVLSSLLHMNNNKPAMSVWLVSVPHNSGPLFFPWKIETTFHAMNKHKHRYVPRMRCTSSKFVVGKRDACYYDDAVRTIVVHIPCIESQVHVNLINSTLHFLAC